MGVTIPRLLDDTQGTADFLYRSDPFRLCIVDLDGKIAYLSPDGEKEYSSDTLDKTIAGQLDLLQANGGHVTAAMAAQNRCDQPGKPAYGFWLPNTEYFINSAKMSKVKGAPVKISDARGYIMEVSKEFFATLNRKKAQVVRLFCQGEKPSSRPVVLLFINGDSPAIRAHAAEIEAFYHRHKSQADCYLVYSGKESEQPLRTAAAAKFSQSCNLTWPCLLDDPENDIAYAYNAQDTPRLCVITRAPHAATVRYTSTNITTALTAAAQLLQTPPAH